MLEIGPVLSEKAAAISSKTRPKCNPRAALVKATKTA